MGQMRYAAMRKTRRLSVSQSHGRGLCFRGGTSHGTAKPRCGRVRTPSELKRNCRPLIDEHIRKGEDLPRPGRHRGRKYRLVRLPATQAAKPELYRKFTGAGIRKAEFPSAWGSAKAMWIGSS